MDDISISVSLGQAWTVSEKKTGVDLTVSSKLALLDTVVKSLAFMKSMFLSSLGCAVIEGLQGTLEVPVSSNPA
jgi:hypothetical protein